MQENCHHTAITYRASTGPEQGFPCVVFPPREKPVFIVGFPVDENRFFPVGNTTQGNPCFHLGMGLQCTESQLGEVQMKPPNVPVLVDVLELISLKSVIEFLSFCFWFPYWELAAHSELRFNFRAKP